jgi:hypothetical protein
LGLEPSHCCVESATHHRPCYLCFPKDLLPSVVASPLRLSRTQDCCRHDPVEVVRRVHLEQILLPRLGGAASQVW